MKLKFKQQQYQTDAVNNLVRVFSGQTKGFRKQVVARTGTYIQEVFSNKKIEITEADVLKNVQNLQREQKLKPAKKLDGGYNFTVEMETGTGKTYVYTKMMLEMHKLYGWNKYIIMVPSVAIREGVHKSLKITAEHFQETYGKKIRFNIYDTKNKSNLVNIKQFGNSGEIEVLIMNYQAFATKGKEARKIYQKLDSLQSEKPIDILKRARPILIIDEPQRFGETAEKMLHEFNPLFITRFSATHKKIKTKSKNLQGKTITSEKERFNKIYRLDAVDAFNQKLVKKIKVKGIEVKENTGTNSFLFLDSITVSKNKYPTAKIEFEIKQQRGIKKTSKSFSQKDDIFTYSGNLEQYKGYVISEISAKTNTVSFTNGIVLSVGQVSGNVTEEHIRRIQIRETVLSHIEKEKELFKKGIKILSLFFIDQVAKYRVYNEKGEQLKAEYEQIFEEEYKSAIAQKSLFDVDYNAYLEKHAVEKVHAGYFSIDKKGKAIDSKEGGSGEKDISAYDLIMKNKERLLSLDEPVRFIFSHSALREGWDNPNIFQICTLKHSQSTISKRQEIGRGLRICVDKEGNRMDVETLDSEFFNINTLTVIASESYDTFAKELQNEILASLSARPTRLTASVFKDLELTNKVGETFVFDDLIADNLIFEFRVKGYIDKEGKITDTLVEAIDKNTFTTIPELENFKEEFAELITKIHEVDTFKASSNAKADNLPKILNVNANFAKKEFQALWSKIKVKTLYDVDFDTNELIKKSVSAIDSQLNVRKVSVHIATGEQNENMSSETLKTGGSFSKTNQQTYKTASILGNTTYDLIKEIAKNAHITRKTTTSILTQIKPTSFIQFQENPEHFITEVSRLINEEKATTLINNITYHKTDDTYSDDIFTINNFNGSLQDNVLEVQKHIYDYVKTDSNIERKFAQELENGEAIVYAKLPSGFKIPTPVGSYNPDWAIVFDTKVAKYVYFIAETKGSMSTMQLKGAEKLKIEYARKHFAKLGAENLKYDVVETYEDLINKILK
ncbi:DEAD/DEAH box helicase family protein [Polaribacter atrinae]|uniref:restriction endonuclease n=1 Tax=Polaribacter atrinae TaxID=1333662 RepID=UPI00249245C8|nr:DEAD/DEAH box helicase family protein [Polaribacter atrinae]